jgi:hypothetical protein
LLAQTKPKDQESMMRHAYTNTSRPCPESPTARAARVHHDLLHWIGSLGAVSAEALAVRLDVSLASARARLADARRRGLLTSSRPLTQAPALYSLTTAGARAGGSRGVCEVRYANTPHLLACASAAAALERCYPGFRAVGEMELRRAERGGDAAMSAPLAALYAGSSGRHRPDLVLMREPTGSMLPVAVEVELTVKAPARLRAICRAWERCLTVAGVIYLVAPPVEAVLLRAVRATEARRIAVVPLAALPLVAIAGTDGAPGTIPSAG